MVTFNIVHLTDLHFGAVANRPNATVYNWRKKLGSLRNGNWRIPATHNPQLAERVAAWIFAETSRLESDGDQLDAIILSGDLATTGLRSDLEAAFQYIDAPPKLEWFRAASAGERDNSRHLATIAGLAESYLLAPGNHDRFQSNLCDPGGKVFDKVFAKYWSSKDAGVVGTIIAKPIGQTGAMERLAIIAADGCLRQSAHANPFPFHYMSQGYMYPDTMASLVTKTNEARRRYPDIAVIWVIHFPPHKSVPRLEMLLNQYDVEMASHALNVCLVLSGHTHENHPYAAGPGSPIWNGGSASQFAEAKGNWLQNLEIEVVNNRFVGASRDNYKWQTVNDVTDFFKVSNDKL